MIQDLDSSIEKLLKLELLDRVGISFDTPDDQFEASPPAVNLFLYDVRENQDLRGNDWRCEITGQNPGARQTPPVRVDCSYLVTAWVGAGAGAIKTEHGVLGEVMALLLKYPRLPNECLQGRLKEQELPLPSAALQPGRLQSLGEFWQALGGKPKAAFDYTVTIAMPGQVIEPGKPVGYVRERELTVGARDRLKEVLPAEQCDLRLEVASDDHTEDQMIRAFKMEFLSNRKKCAVLIVRASGDANTLTIAGYSDAGEFRVVVIDQPDHELSRELKKERRNHDRIIELATAILGRSRSKSKNNQRGDWKKPDEQIADTKEDAF